jgi:hypothetical protein
MADNLTDQDNNLQQRMSTYNPELLSQYPE